MDKKLIKEDISNMKFLMTYKAGKVISEQEQLEKRYGSFGNMKRPDFKGDEYYDDRDRKVRDSELFGIAGDDFDTEEFSDFKSYDKKYPKDDENSPNWFKGSSGKKMFDTYKKTTGKPFKVKTRKGDMEEQYEDGNGMNWTQNTTMDRQRPISIDTKDEIIVPILKKHNLLNKASLVRGSSIMFENQSSEVIQKLLSILHLLTELQFLAIVDCESADFSDVDVCSLSQLSFINLNGTENNLEEQGYECVNTEGSGFFYLS